MPAADSRTHAPQRLNRRAIAIVSLANTAHFYSLCSIFSYAAFLCTDMGWVADIDHAGMMAGLLPTAVMLGRILTSWPWGILSDRIGRNRCLELSMYANALGNLLFGFATRPWAALAVRFVLLGMANGWVVVLGPITQDIGGAERQSEVLAIILASGAVVQMAGPALGGLLYATLSTSLPALAPSLVGASVGILAGLAVRFGMPTFPLVEAAAADAAPATIELATAADPGATAADANSAGASVLVEGTNADGTNAEGCTGANAQGGSTRRNDTQPPPLCASLCAHPLPLVMAVRAGCGLTVFGMFDVLPLWLAASRGVGGLGVDERRLGLILALSSLAMLPWAIRGMGAFVRRAGVVRSLWTSLLLTASLYVLTVPTVLTAYAASPNAGAGACVLLASAGNAAINTASTAVFAATNNACSSHRARMGSITGVAVTVEAIGKMLGPAIGAPMLSALLDALRPAEGGFSVWANGGEAAFAIFGAGAVLLAVAALALPKSVENPRRASLLEGSKTRSEDACDV